MYIYKESPDNSCVEVTKYHLLFPIVQSKKEPIVCIFIDHVDSNIKFTSGNKSINTKIYNNKTGS